MHAFLIALVLWILIFPINVIGQTRPDSLETTEQDTGKNEEKKIKDGKKSSKKAKSKKGEKKSQAQVATREIQDSTNFQATWLCERFHSGKMYFIDKNYHGIKIKRKRRREIWYNMVTNNKLTFKISWESPCHYRLIFKKSRKPTKFRKGYDISCKITACIEEYYDCVCDVNAIMQYLSVQKDLTNAEVKLKTKQEKAKLEEEEKAIRLAEQEKKDPEKKEGSKEKDKGGDR